MRQYIGARYVPKFADPIDWDNTRSYEALTMVSYLGDSYTSKKPVPPGIAINNTEYWALTGSYNSQIAEIRSDLQDLTDSYNVTIQPKDIVCIGDSYGLNSAGWSGWGYELADIYNNGNVYAAATGGAGWVNASEGRNFLQTLEYIDTLYPGINKDNVSHIIVLGGYNDMATGLTEAQCVAAMSAFKTYAKTNYPNAVVHFGCIGFSYTDAHNNYTIREVYNRGIYPRAAATAGIRFYANFVNIITDASLVFHATGDPNSGFHPNSLGCKAIANRLNEYIFNSCFDVVQAGIVLNSLVVSKNGETVVTPYQDKIGVLSGINTTGLTFPFNTWVTVKTFDYDNASLWGGSTAVSDNFHASGPVKWIDYNNGNVHYLVYRITRNKIEFNNTTSTSTFDPSTLSSNSGFIIDPFTLSEYNAF